VAILPKQPSGKGPARLVPARPVAPARAAPDHSMTHLAIWNGLADGQDGPETEWGEHVTDEEYTARWPRAVHLRFRRSAMGTGSCASPS
jgi:hypothetical protein